MIYVSDGKDPDNGPGHTRRARKRARKTGKGKLFDWFPSAIADNRTLITSIQSAPEPQRDCFYSSGFSWWLRFASAQIARKHQNHIRLAEKREIYLDLELCASRSKLEENSRTPHRILLIAFLENLSQLPCFGFPLIGSVLELIGRQKLLLKIINQLIFYTQKFRYFRSHFLVLQKKRSNTFSQDNILRI